MVDRFIGSTGKNVFLLTLLTFTAPREDGGAIRGPGRAGQAAQPQEPLRVSGGGPGAVRRLR